MSLHLQAIVDPAAVKELVADGYIRERTHPADPTLRILNYTEKAQYEGRWTHETRNCRGLIIGADDQVLARPWAKFFNYGQHPEGAFDLAGRVEVTDKMDGSLGILYPAPDGWAIATRGSFASDQALHATELLRRRYLPGRDWNPLPGYTYLFEIVYPANRIVLDYGDLDDLVLLGAVHTDTGVSFGPQFMAEWRGPRTTTWPVMTLGEALALPPRPNAEGIVVRWLAGPDVLIKIKQEDYVRLHRLVTGLSERSVWEHLAANGGTVHGLLEQIPDEFHAWVKGTAAALIQRHDATYDVARREHQALVRALGQDASRKDYALAIRETAPDLAPYCFQLLDGRDPSPAIWKAIRPIGSTPMLHTSEDVA